MRILYFTGGQSKAGHARKQGKMTDCLSSVIGASAHFLVYFFTGKAVVSMCQKFTPEQLKNMDMETKDGVIFQMQDRLDKLEHDYENLI